MFPKLKFWAFIYSGKYNMCKNLLLREQHLHFVTLAMMAVMMAVMMAAMMVPVTVIVDETTIATRSSILLDEMIIDITS